MFCILCFDFDFLKNYFFCSSSEENYWSHLRLKTVLRLHRLVLHHLHYLEAKRKRSTRYLVTIVKNILKSGFV